MQKNHLEISLKKKGLRPGVLSQEIIVLNLSLSVIQSKQVGA